MGKYFAALENWFEEEMKKKDEKVKMEETGGRLEEASRLYEAKTREGCDGCLPQVSLDLRKKQEAKWWNSLDKVEQSGRWPQEACMAMSFLIPKNVTSERPIALIPTLIRWWEALRASEVMKVAAKGSNWMGRHGWSRRRSSTNSMGNIFKDGDIQGQSKGI